MLFELPNDDTLYQALLDRDDSYDGQAYVCVSSTGIFCRLTCPARKPKRENCQFRASIAECIEAGFRPCKRCSPLQPSALADPCITQLMQALDSNPQHRFSERDIAKLGLDLSTVRRAFKRQFGMTFLEMARMRRLREGFESLADDGEVIQAQQQAGFESASAFRAAFAKLMGVAPSSLGKQGILLADWIATPLGDMLAVSSHQHLVLLEFIDRRALPTELAKLHKLFKGDIGIGCYPPIEQLRAELQDFFEGRSAEFSTPLAPPGSDFSQQVWAALREIPAGTTCTYAELAEKIGRPTAVRAVARANGANQIALLIPCHRVIGADGSLTGYGGGLWRKQRLIEIERKYQ